MKNAHAANERILFPLLLVCAVLVFWLFHALPFQDLPGHAGLIAIRHRFATSSFDQHFFVLSEHLGPYTIFRTLGELLNRGIGPMRAVRVLATLPVIATPFAFLFARRRLFGDTELWAGFYGIVLSFGLMTLFGFASYLLSVAILLFALTLWLVLFASADEVGPFAWRQTWKQELQVALLSAALFLAHGHAYGMLVGLVGLSAIVTGKRFHRLLMLRALAPSFVFAVYVEWMERAATYPAGAARVRQSALTPHFQGVLDKLSLLVTPTLMTRFGIDAAVSLVLWVLVVVCGWKTLRSTAEGVAERDKQTHYSRALLAGAAALFVIFLASPHEFGWFGFIDGRLLPVILALGLLATDTRALSTRLERWFTGFAPFAAGLLVAIALLASSRFQDEATGFDEMLCEIPEGARLLNLPLHPNSRIFTAHPFVHYDKLFVIGRDILPSDLWFHQGTALYPTPESPVLRLPESYSESNLHTIEWPAYKLEDWDYALIRLEPGEAPEITPPSLTLVRHDGGWWLYKIGRPRD